MKAQHYFPAAGAAAMLGPGPQALAQAKAKADDNYPSRPVRMIVPFAPGSASDTVGRIIQPAMADLLKQQDQVQPEVTARQ